MPFCEFFSAGIQVEKKNDRCVCHRNCRSPHNILKFWSVLSTDSAGSGGGGDGGKPRAMWRRSSAWWTLEQRRHRRRESRRKWHTSPLSDQREKKKAHQSEGRVGGRETIIHMTAATFGLMLTEALFRWSAFCGTGRTGPRRFLGEAPLESSGSPGDRQEEARQAWRTDWRWVGSMLSWRCVGTEPLPANGLVNRALLPAKQHRDSCYVGKLAKWEVNKNSSGE